MRIPILKGTIRRRLLVNFRADPEIVKRLIPEPFTPKLHNGFAIIGICLIRLEHIRPRFLPEWLGFSSENAAHRIAVEWTDAEGDLCEGVFIPRRDSGSALNRFAGGRIFPGQHHPASFSIRDDLKHVDFNMQAIDGSVSMRVVGEESETLPASSCFSSLAEVSEFFESGSLGYSVTRDDQRLDGLILRTIDWRIAPFQVSDVYSSFYEEPKYFPAGSVEYDHALIMRNIRHEWHSAGDLCCKTRS
ncbi:MAG: DUF2071 domain-containing protein [Chthoniobacterales bacterium]